MRERTAERISIKKLAPRRLALALVLGAVIGTISALKGNAAAMRYICEHITRPWHNFMSRCLSVLPFSGAELIYAVAVVFCVGYLGYSVYRLIKYEGRLLQLYKTVLTLGVVALSFWAGLCLFWSPCYYAPRFAETAGISDAPVSKEELRAVTAHFAELANEYSTRVERDNSGRFVTSRRSIVDRAAEVFSGAEAEFPCLAGAPLRPKGIICSQIMSYLNFTGFFFPLTGEANLNMDSPAFMLPSTAQHEIAHQRGVAQEQDCNFVAVYSCMGSKYPDYVYSGALLAYIYLGNALHGADYDAWLGIYQSLNDTVRADFAENSDYWQPYQESAAQQASNTVYDNFLRSNGQELGRQSYGACVDLLVNYYYPRLEK